VGSTPLPVEVLRWLAQQAKAELWSTQPDIVLAAKDIAMLVATVNGERQLTLPESMTALESGETGLVHHVNMELGEVRFFVGNPCVAV
jgi:hypothetical protein